MSCLQTEKAEKQQKQREKAEAPDHLLVQLATHDDLVHNTAINHFDLVDPKQVCPGLLSSQGCLQAFTATGSPDIL